MNEEEYLAARVDDQIGWYDRKSIRAQRMYKRLNGMEIIAAAAIPLLSGFAVDILPVPLIAGILGATIAIISAVQGMNQYQANWTEYRATCASLKQEKFLFLTKAEPYHEGNPFKLFVYRVESLISDQNTAWSSQTGGKVENQD